MTDTQATAAARRAGLAIVMVVLGIVLTIGSSVGFTLWTVNHSQHNWCDTLNLLNAAPRPGGRAATATGRSLVEYDARLYRDFQLLRDRLGCT